jgi:hypothetical protein
MRLPELEDTRSLDPALPQRQLEEFGRSLRSERHRAMVDTFGTHMYHEMVSLDIDALMATLVPHPVFRFYGLGGLTGLDGFDEVRGYYEKSREARTTGLTVSVNRIVVDDDDVVMDAYVRCSGTFASAAWDVEIDPSAVLQKRLIVVVPFEDGLMAGEEQYFDGPFTAADTITAARV